MGHTEILGLLPGHLAGRGTPQERERVQAHLALCGPCQRIAQAWPQGAVVNLMPAVMAGLRPAQREERGLAWAMPATAVLALGLLVGAFWHPERGWVKADRAFADLAAPSSAAPWRGGLR